MSQVSTITKLNLLKLVGRCCYIMTTNWGPVIGIFRQYAYHGVNRTNHSFVRLKPTRITLTRSKEVWRYSMFWHRRRLRDSISLQEVNLQPVTSTKDPKGIFNRPSSLACSLEANSIIELTKYPQGTGNRSSCCCASNNCSATQGHPPLHLLTRHAG
jgi:hypothetical protein